MSTLSDLKNAIRLATADGRVSDQEWQSMIEPLADSTPLEATPESHAILELWTSDSFQIDPQTRQWMHDFLVSRGYPMPDQKPNGIPGATLTDEISAGNVGEVDPAFQSVVEATGHAQDDGVNIGVIDNGFDMFDPELGRKGWVNPGEVDGNGADDDHDGLVDDKYGWDFVDWNQDLENPDGNWHGTHVAGIATAGTEQVHVIPEKVILSPYDIHKVAEAVDFAASKGAKVISMSFGIDTPERVAVMKQVLAAHPDVLFVAAAGNDNRALESYDPDSFLGDDSFPNLAVVAASDESGNKADFSNYGPHASLAAPGVNVLSTIPGGYARMSGTSMAAPAVSNAAAKCLVLDPGLTPAAIKQLLTDTTDVSDAWTGKVASGGVIDPARAFQLAGLTGLVRGGMAPEAAADKLGLTGDARARLLALVPKYVQLK